LGLNRLRLRVSIFKFYSELGKEHYEKIARAAAVGKQVAQAESVQSAQTTQNVK